MEFNESVGFEYISDTLPHTGRFGELYALEATVIASASVKGAGGNAFTAVPIPAGGSIYGVFESVTLTSGKVIAYDL